MNKSLRILLFEALKNNMPKRYTITYGDMDELAENTCAIYMRNSGTSPSREVSGVYLNRYSRVLMNIHSNKKQGGVIDGEVYCEEVIEAISYLNNYKYVDDETGESVTIVQVSIVGDVNTLGKNLQEIPVYSINFNINYGREE